MKALHVLRRIDQEAQSLLDQHEGIHNMHGSRWGINHWYESLRRGDRDPTRIDWNNVARLLIKMRQMAAGVPVSIDEDTRFSFIDCAGL